MATQTYTVPLSFDRLMNATCDVLVPTGLNPDKAGGPLSQESGSGGFELENGQGELVAEAKSGLACDIYGQPLYTYDTVCTAVPCRASTMGGGREWLIDKKYAENDWKIFMRPIVLDDAGNAFQLSPRYWLNVYLPDGITIMVLNLKSVNDPSGIGHHLEIIGLQIIP